MVNRRQARRTSYFDQLFAWHPAWASEPPWQDADGEVNDPDQILYHDGVIVARYAPDTDDGTRNRDPLHVALVDEFKFEHADEPMDTTDECVGPWQWDAGDPQDDEWNPFASVRIYRGPRGAVIGAVRAIGSEIP